MLNKKFMIIFLAVFFSNILAALSVDYRIEEKLPVNSEAINVHSRMIEGANYYFVKYIDENEEIKGVIFDSEFREIQEEDIPYSPPSKISEELMKIIDNEIFDGKKNVNILVRLVTPFVREADYSEVAEDYIFGESYFTFIEDENGGRFINFLEQKILNQKRMTVLEDNNKKKIDEILNTIDEFAGRNDMIGSEAINNSIKNESLSIELSIPKNEIKNLLYRNEDIVLAIELQKESVDSLAAAMLDTNVDPYVTGNTSRQGDGVGIYMTETGCPDAGFVSNYYRISAANRTNHSESVSAIIRGVSPLSYLYCKRPAQLPSSTDRSGYNGNPAIHIMNRSNNDPNPDGNYNVGDMEWDDYIYDYNIPAFVSAGNFNICPDEYVMAPGVGLNVITVGNYDDSTDTINTSANHGSCWVNPTNTNGTNNQKPELSAPGTGITAGGHTYTGTSQASPHAAGIAADFMGVYDWLTFRPYYLKAFMLASSTDQIAGGINAVGMGGIDFRSGFFDGTGKRWEAASTSSWSSWDASDPYPNNGYVDYTFSVNSGNTDIIVALSWMNKGTYTYDNRWRSYPIGLDLDLCIFNPSGGLVACSSSYYNGWEVVRFSPLVEGTYRARISKYADRDPNTKLHMGLRINRDN